MTPPTPPPADAPYGGAGFYPANRPAFDAPPPPPGAAPQPGRVGRIVSRVVVAAPAVLLTAWWARGYFITDWWMHQRAPNRVTGLAGEIRGVRAAGGTLSYWHMTADPAPGLLYAPFSPLEGSASNERTGWFWDSEMRRGQVVDPAGRATVLTPLGFVHSLDGSDRTSGARWSREAWLAPMWAIVLPAWLPYLLVHSLLSRRRKRLPPPGQKSGTDPVSRA